MLQKWVRNTLPFEVWLLINEVINVCLHLPNIQLWVFPFSRNVVFGYWSHCLASGLWALEVKKPCEQMLHLKFLQAPISKDGSSWNDLENALKRMGQSVPAKGLIRNASTVFWHHLYWTWSTPPSPEAGWLNLNLAVAAYALSFYDQVGCSWSSWVCTLSLRPLSALACFHSNLGLVLGSQDKHHFPLGFEVGGFTWYDLRWQYLKFSSHSSSYKLLWICVWLVLSWSGLQWISHSIVIERLTVSGG